MMRSSRRRIDGAITCLVGAFLVTPQAVAAPPHKPRSKRPPPPPPTTATATATSAPRSIDVTVIQLAGTQAYLRPGSRGGVLRGAKVAINHKEYAVVQTTDSFAVIDVGNEPPHEQDRGRASVVGSEEEKPKELVKPQPLSNWEHAWSKAEAPANSQRPRFVPLGNGEGDRRWDVRFSAISGGSIPLGEPRSGIAYAEFNARVHAEPFASSTMLDLDVSLQRWFAANLDARDGGEARPVLWLRELLVSHGAGHWFGSLGRMRYAASTLGTLDGARVRTRLGDGFAVGAFVGLLPNPLSDKPSLDAQRFGVEANYSRPEIDLRPEAALVVHGSTFGGRLDERRVSGTFALYPGLSRLGGYFEITNFDANNPWKASAIALTAAGLDASMRSGIFQFGGRLDLRQPERSRWLASFLPTSWFCRTVPTTVAGGEACDGSVSTRALAAVDASMQIGHVSLTVGGTTTHDLSQTGGAPDMTGGFATGRVVRIAKVARVDVSGSYSRATYLDILDGSVGPGVTLLGEALDVSSYYRIARLRYRPVNTSLVEQGVGATAEIFPSSEMVFAVQSEVMGGSDAKAFLFFGMATWRPRF
jgi:hypothetical protein